MSAPRLLDLTRSLRRVGRVATGVDRVERAYLDAFLADDVPVFGLMRTAFGYVLLDRAGLVGFRDRLSGGVPWAGADLMSRMPRGRTAVQARAEAYVRKLASARALPLRLNRMLRRELPDGFDYYNTGHSNLTERVLVSTKAAKGRIHVLIHDVIPIEFPDFQRPGTVAPFEAKLKRVRRMADRVIYNSLDTRSRTEAVMRAWGALPDGIVAHLGTIAPTPDAAALPQNVFPTAPFFVVVGTIEPRKNHAFLLDLWEEMGRDAPRLLFCGTRGWNNIDVFDRLDALLAHSAVQEVSDLDDAALAALVQKSAGLLFPSHAEGYGLPPVEALMLQTRVLCNDLGVLREVLQDSAVFIPVSDRENWLKTIKEWEQIPPNAGKGTSFVGPTWPDHFKTVLRLR
jgi:glycosyltransferase involved in cell wall biosynthesis